MWNVENGNTIYGVMLSNTICGGVLCLSVANMTHMILKFMLAASISIKETQFILQKKSNGLKNKKGWQEWHKGINMPP